MNSSFTNLTQLGFNTYNRARISLGSVWDRFGIGREIEHSRKPLLTTPNEHSKNKSGTISQKMSTFRKIFIPR